MTSTTKFCHFVQIKLQMSSCDQSLVTLAFLQNTLSQFYKDLTRKNTGWWFFCGVVLVQLFKFNNFGLALGMTLKFYISVAKALKLKFRKFCLQKLTQSECKEMCFIIISTGAVKVCRYCNKPFMQASVGKVDILKYTKTEIYTDDIQNFTEASLEAELIHSRKRCRLCGQSLIQESPNTNREVQCFEKT